MVIIEHQLDVVKRADWVIDVGPDGGDAGGRIVAAGTPELIAATPGSLTGVALAPLLAESPVVRKTERPPRMSTRPTTRRSPAR